MKSRLKSIVKELKAIQALSTDAIVLIARVTKDKAPMMSLITKYLIENPKLSHSQYYELISMANGYPNFDTFSSQLSKLIPILTLSINSNLEENMKQLAQVYKSASLSKANASRAILHADGSISIALLTSKGDKANFIKTNLSAKFTVVELESSNNQVTIIVNNAAPKVSKLTSIKNYFFVTTKDMHNAMNNIEIRIKELDEAIKPLINEGIQYLPDEEVMKFDYTPKLLNNRDE